MRVLVMGLGSIGHTYVSNASNDVVIDVLTSSNLKIEKITNSNGKSHLINECYCYETIEKIDHDYLIITLPFRYKAKRLEQIKDLISKDTTIVIVPGNQGAFYYMPKELQKSNPIILTERVLQIARIEKKYELVHIFGTRKDMNVAALNGANIENFINIYPMYGDVKIHLNHLDISLISSNASLHTSRLYDLYHIHNNYGKEVLFYEEFTDVAAKLFVDLELEVLEIVKAIELKKEIKLDVYNMFIHFGIDEPLIENSKKQINNFHGFQGITFLAKDQDDLANNRYMVDDCILGIYFYIQLAKQYGVELKVFPKIYKWATNVIHKDKVLELDLLNIN